MDSPEYAADLPMKMTCKTTTQVSRLNRDLITLHFIDLHLTSKIPELIKQCQNFNGDCGSCHLIRYAYKPVSKIAISTYTAKMVSGTINLFRKAAGNLCYSAVSVLFNINVMLIMYWSYHQMHNSL